MWGGKIAQDSMPAGLRPVGFDAGKSLQIIEAL